MPDVTETPPPRRFAVLLLQPHSSTSQITERTLNELTTRLDRLGPDPLDLDVWLESPGGSGDAAYRTALLLRSRAETLRFVVANSARSAATLMVLCADEVFMADNAELGPLDAQMSIPRGVTSAADAARTLDFVQNQAIRLSTRATLAYRSEFLVPAADAIEAGSRLAVALIDRLARSIEPATILDAQNQLDATERYAKRLLRAPYVRRGDVVSASLRQELKETARRLVRGYPTHDFSIDRTEAAQLRLPIRDLEEYPDAGDVRDALATALVAGQESFSVRELPPYPERPMSVAGDRAVPRQPGRDETQHRRGQSLMTGGRHSARRSHWHSASGMPDGALTEAPASVDAMDASGIDLDDAWIWNHDPQPFLADAPMRNRTGGVHDTATTPREVDLTGQDVLRRPRRSTASEWPDRQDERGDAAALQHLRGQQVPDLTVVALPE